MMSSTSSRTGNGGGSSPLVVNSSTTTTTGLTTSSGGSSSSQSHRTNSSTNNNNSNGNSKNRSNGFTIGSPLIGRNYPQHRVSKSPSESSESSSTVQQQHHHQYHSKSPSSSSRHLSSSASSNKTSIITLHPVNNSYVPGIRQNEFIAQELSSQQNKRSSTAENNIMMNQNTDQHNYDNLPPVKGTSSSPSDTFDRRTSLRNSLKNHYGQILTRNNTSSSVHSDPEPEPDNHNQQRPKGSHQHHHHNHGTSSSSSSSPHNSVHRSEPELQWIEIMEPKSGTKMFANLATGECRWAEPKGVPIVRQSNPNLTQWWELYDHKSRRYYYYSVKDSKTIWQKPTTPDSIVVPLAKLQIIKHNSQEGSSSFDRFISSGASGAGSLTSPSSPSLSSPVQPPIGTCCPRCRSTNKIMVDSATQTFQTAPQLNQNQPSQTRKPSMISRWTQTTTQTPVNVRGLLDPHRHHHASLSKRGTGAPSSSLGLSVAQQPSLRHYLISEARFAARGAPPPVQEPSERIYDPITESYYDSVPDTGNYCEVYDEYCDEADEELDDIIYDEDDYEYEEDEESDFSCDADDEYDDDRYSYDNAGQIDDDDDDDSDLDDDDIDDHNDGHSTVDDSHLYDDAERIDHHQRQVNLLKDQQRAFQRKNHMYQDYDQVDSDEPPPSYLGRLEKRDTPPPSQQQQQKNSPHRDHHHLDGLRMSASFTAVDFKRNAVGRSSYTPSLQQPRAAAPTQQSQLQQQPLPVKDAYSNPFNHSGSLRSSTGRISGLIPGGSSNQSIAERIQLFNQKSLGKTKTPTTTTAVPVTAAMSKSRSPPRNSDSSGSLLRERFYHYQPPNQNQQKPMAINKSSPANEATPSPQQQQPSKSTSLTLIAGQPATSNVSMPMDLATSGSKPSQAAISSQPSLAESKRSSVSGRFPITHQQQAESPIPDSSMLAKRATVSPERQHPSFMINLNDSHKIMLNKSATSAVIVQDGHGKPSQKPTKDSGGKSKPKDSKKNGTKKKNTAAEQHDSKTGGAKLKHKNSSSGPTATGANGNNSIESFARECVARHRKGGIFSKKKTLKSMLIHTKKPLKKPMISTISDGLLVKESVACFKLIQTYMGDRCPSPTASMSSINESSRVSPVPASDEQLLVRLINVCVTLVPLRDEVLVQVARQVTQNPSPESERRGLELMCTLFWYFTASNKLSQHLHAFLAGHRNPFTATVRRKFEQQTHRSRYTHSHLFYRKPHSVDEVARVLRAVRAQHVGIFGETLADAVVLSSDDPGGQRIPWPVMLLTEALLEARHEDREGVFRCVGDMDDVHKLKMKLDTILPGDRQFDELTGRNSKPGSRKLTDEHDIHVIASTLKLYFRELRQSIIPTEMYLEALDCAHDAQRACLLLDKLPSINRSTLVYLIRFLQIFSTNQHVRDTKMDDANLSMVWAPNILRSPLNQTMAMAAAAPPGTKAASQLNNINSANIYEHTRAEMSLVRTLIQHLETNSKSGNVHSPTIMN